LNKGINRTALPKIGRAVTSIATRSLAAKKPGDKETLQERAPKVINRTSIKALRVTQKNRWAPPLACAPPKSKEQNLRIFRD
jgi:hypothetical protein